MATTTEAHIVVSRCILSQPLLDPAGEKEGKKK
jgi:hypothetical protein